MILFKNIFLLNKMQSNFRSCSFCDKIVTKNGYWYGDQYVHVNCIDYVSTQNIEDDEKVENINEKEISDYFETNNKYLDDEDEEYDSDDFYDQDDDHDDFNDDFNDDY